jgi:hypothetical protein
MVARAAIIVILLGAIADLAAGWKLGVYVAAAAFFALLLTLQQP